MSVFIAYIFLGLSLAAPIGPVNAAQLDRGIKSGFFHAWLVGLGATVADGIYMFLVFLGVYHLIEIPFVQSFLWLFGFFVLVYTGIESLSGANKIELNHEKMNRESPTKSFFAGFFMSLFNPITVLFWLGIFGSILAKTVTSYSQIEVLLYVTAIFIGITVWDFTMAGLSSTLRRFLSKKLLTTISLLSGLSLIGFGIYFGIQAAKILF
ncbi:LysE family transporter [Evansella cellulosilytica]|uniref:Lysine exporter protein (LYSE/YGGA) n=1 Tax=Evansella cellulosilytica (strain ATCC 21833 / DSM 2522 / FERM P-1141 / JCM 9156 / N-4) TaxID=649639 RepID=E6U0X4_EVAC2|nr:LysE family transporter [Evansella cellulosilytica]ADU30286.1 Lysine exporter protein (LYSE/YGGA) [Evansella cellulosilytica DSM 2522]